MNKQNDTNDHRRLKTVGVSSFFLILMTILMCSLVIGGNSYPSIGNDNQNFIGNGMLFNSLFSEDDQTLYTRFVTNPKFIPLVDDLDNDGTNEIIVLDNNNIEIYQERTLTLIDSISLSYDQYNYLEIFDIDNDGTKEIMTLNEDYNTPGNLSIVSFNGTSINLENEFNIRAVTGVTGNKQSIIKCDSANSCMVIYTYNKQPNVGYVYARAFDSSGVTSPEQTIYSLDVNPGGGWAYHEISTCFSNMPVAQLTDIDRDGETEYTFNFISTWRSASPIGDDTKVYTYILRNNNSNIITENSIENTDILEVQGSSVENCEIGHYGRYFTSPSVYDYDGAYSNGDEIIIGIMEDVDEFKMYTYEADTTFLRTFPNVFQADGIIVSNVIRINAFYDSDVEDFCVLGFANDDNELDLVCGSMTTGLSPTTREFKSKNATMTNYLDTNTTTYNYNIMTHSVQSSTETTQGSDLSEILTTFGVFAIDWNTVFSLQLGGNIYALTQLYTTPKDRASIIPVDVENVGVDDMLMYTTNNVWYLDDGFINDNAQIDAYSVDPCIDTSWKQNTTVSVTINPVDFDGDQVQARAILYYGDPNNDTQDSGWSTASGSGVTFPFTFYAYNLSSGSILRLMARDNLAEHNNTADIIDLTFRVTTDGVSFGDCRTVVEGLSVDPVRDAIGVVDSDEVTLQNNAITDFVDEYEQTFGIPMLIVILLGTLMFDIILFLVLHRHPVIALGSIILCDIAIFIISALLGFIPTAFVVTILALIFIFGIIYFVYLYLKYSTGGNFGG